MQDLRCVQRMLTDLIGKLHIFQCRQIADQIVKLKYKPHILTAVLGQLLFIQVGDLPPVQKHLTCGQGVHTTQNIQQGRFACTGGAYNDHQFPFFYRKGSIPKGIDLHLSHVVGLSYILKFHKCHSGHLIRCFFLIIAQIQKNIETFFYCFVKKSSIAGAMDDSG